MKRIHVQLSRNGISSAIRQVERYKTDMETKLRTLCNRLGQLGLRVASADFSSVGEYYDVNDVTVDVVKTDNGCKVVANGQAVAFIEFGAGLIGYGHPRAGEFGMGPGTYPGKGHWDDPKGWITPGGNRSFGNAPAAAMSNASAEIMSNVRRIAREVFR